MRRHDLAQRFIDRCWLKRLFLALTQSSSGVVYVVASAISSMTCPPCSPIEST
jgi:hypothetical protein